MTTWRCLLAATWLVTVASAQEGGGTYRGLQVQRFDYREVGANLQRHAGKETPRTMSSRLSRMLMEVLAVDGKTSVGMNGDAEVILIGKPEQGEALTVILAQLRRPDLQELRLQCTVVTMPVELATAAGLTPEKAVAVDEAKAGKLLKEAVAAKGALRNLPEARGLPLQEFFAGKAPVDARPDNASRVSVHALPLAADEAWLQLELTGSDLGTDDLLQAPVTATMRLEVGGGAMAMQAMGRQATVLWVRFVGTRTAAPPKENGSPPKGSEPQRPAGK